MYTFSVPGWSQGIPPAPNCNENCIFPLRQRDLNQLRGAQIVHGPKAQPWLNPALATALSSKMHKKKIHSLEKSLRKKSTFSQKAPPPNPYLVTGLLVPNALQAMWVSTQLMLTDIFNAALGLVIEGVI